MEGIFIEYGDVSIGAKQSFFLQDNGIENEISNSAQLRENIENFENYTNPIELYNAVLDGSSLPIPKNNKGINIGLWSYKLSDDDGNFDTPIELIFVADKKFSSTGIQFEFDKYNNVFPTKIDLSFYDEDQLKETITFSPDNPIYSQNVIVEDYNKIISKIYSINMPRTSLKIKSIEFGFVRKFYGEDTKNCSVSKKINLISAELPISTAEIIVFNNENLIFQEKQPISIYFNEKFKSKTYIRKAKRKSKNEWSIQTENFVGLLESIDFYGDVYEDKSAIELIDELFKTAGIKYKIDEQIIASNEVLSGHIPMGNCRSALQLILFSIGAICYDKYEDGESFVYITKPIYENTQTIDKSRIMQGSDIDEEDKLKSVSLDYHIYYTTNTQEYSQILYEASHDEENVFIAFSEPMCALSIEPVTVGESGGEIIEQSANHAIINIKSGYSLKGYKYVHCKVTKTKNNENNYSNIGNKITITNATLVSQSNVDNVLERCYNYYIKNKVANASVVDRRHISGGNFITYGQMTYGSFPYKGKTPIEITRDDEINISEMITIYTEFGDEFCGNIESQSFNLNGKSILNNIVLR